MSPVSQVVTRAQAGVSTTYFPRDGELVVEIMDSDIAVIGWASPGNFDTSVTPGRIGSVTPGNDTSQFAAVQFDAGTLAYLNFLGLTPGIWNLGPVLRTGLGFKDVLSSYTPLGQPSRTQIVHGPILFHSANFNGEGLVDGFDFLIWQRNFGRDLSGSDAGAFLHRYGDSDRDAHVDQYDYLRWQEQLGGLFGVAVPEPPNLLLLALACIGLMASRWLRR